jgi:hypothetical protein
MTQETGSVLGLQATTRIATSALPCAPVLPCRSGGSTQARAACWAC